MLRRISLLLSIACLTALTAAPPTTTQEAQAQSSAPAPRRGSPVAPGVERLEYAFTKLDGAPVAAQVLTVSPREDVRLTSVLAQGAVPGLEDVQAMNQRLQPRGGVAVLNSGFWLNQPVGEPNAYFATGGALVSESETQGSKARGTFATTPQGLSIIDRIDARVHIRATPQPLPVTGVNRLDRTQPPRDADGADPLYLYTPTYGPFATIPAPGSSAHRGDATVLAVSGMTVAASGEGVPAVAPAAERVAAGSSVPIPADGVLLVAYNAAGTTLAEVVVGSTLQSMTEIGFPERSRPDVWSAIAEGVAAGPLIVRDGAMTDRASWEEEGFPDSSHSAPPAPRSAVGVRADGTTLLVAVDGRQYDRDDPTQQHSAGMSMVELASFMIGLGAVDALSLDGGGSTQLSVDGIMRNRPCATLRRCGPNRVVASGIAVVHDYEATSSVRLSGPGREATAAAVAIAGFPAGAPEVVLASAGNFPDALAGGPLAATLGAPLLLSGGDAMAPQTTSALAALGTRRVTLLGGTSAIGSAVTDELVRLGYEVRRLSGTGRVETAVAIADAVEAPSGRLFLASAGGFADALSAAAPAGMLRAPVLLTGRDILAPATRDAIAASNAAEVVLVGGGSAISSTVEEQVQALRPDLRVVRLAGVDRFGTARAVNEWAEEVIPDLDLTGLVVARGDSFPDALSGGPLAASRRQLLMTVTGDDIRISTEAGAYLDRRGEGPLSEVTLLGGLGALSSYQQWQLDQLAR